jgi:hypothetical protein
LIKPFSGAGFRIAVIDHGDVPLMTRYRQIILLLENVISANVITMIMGIDRHLEVLGRKVNLL